MVREENYVPTPVPQYHSMNKLPEKIIPPQDLQLCMICARGFTPDRIRAHEQICRKFSGVSRNSFNASQQRIKGIQAENFPKMGVQESVSNKFHENRPSALFTKWRLKHEEFIRKIRDAKTLTEGKGPSKLNDLLVLSTTEPNKYVHCPHCSRQFNQPSAERHINLCASMMYRTPKSKTRLAGSTDQKTSTDVINK